MGACVWSALQSVPEPLLASGWLVHKGPLEQGGWWPVKGRRQSPQVEVEGTVAETHLLLDSCWLRPYVPTVGLSLDCICRSCPVSSACACRCQTLPRWPVYTSLTLVFVRLLPGRQREVNHRTCPKGHRALLLAVAGICAFPCMSMTLVRSRVSTCTLIDLGGARVF